MMQRRSVLQAIMTLALIEGLASGKAEARTVALHVLAGEPEWLSILVKLAEEIEHRDGLRLIPAVGRGSLQSLADLGNLPQTDAALVTADSLDYAKAQGLLRGERYQFSYIARLAVLPIVLVTHRSIGSLTLLANKKLCTGAAQSANFATGELIFSALGVPFVRVAKSEAEGLRALQRGEADGALLLGTEALNNGIALTNHHILPLPVPQGLEAVYAPHKLDRKDLPSLPQDAPPLDTIAVDLLLATLMSPTPTEKKAAIKQLITALYDNNLHLPWQIKQLAAAHPSGWQISPLAARAAKVE